MRPREAGSATAQPEAVLRTDLGDYPSKDTKVASTWCECHIFVLDIAASKDDTGLGLRSLGFSDPENPDTSAAMLT